MKNKLHSLTNYYKAHPKRFWLGGGILVIVLLFVIFGGGKDTSTIISTVERGDLKETVLATGQVTSEVDLDLSFGASDVVKTVSVEVGDKVYKGQVLATLENRETYASLQEAQGALKAAQAKYQKVLEGSSNEEIAVAQALLDSAESDLESKKRLQDTLVASAYRKLLNTDLTPTVTSGSISTLPTVTGTYSGTKEGTYTVRTYGSSGGAYFSYDGLESGTGVLSSNAPIAIGTKGLFIQFPSGYIPSTEVSVTIHLPNIQSASYVANYNGYQEAMDTRVSVVAAAEALVNQRSAELALKKASARSVDLDAADAEVLTAQARVTSAAARYENTVLRAPVAGTVVRVDTKIGELVQAQVPVMVLQDVDDLYIEAKINEANIAKLKVGQTTSMTLDAFGPSEFFTGTIAHIDPSATTDDGVVNYKIRTSIDDSERREFIRPGMNANMTILVSETPDVISIPKAAILKEESISYVNVVLSEKRKDYEKREITTGASGDGNVVEILSGLSEGERIAITDK